MNAEQQESMRYADLMLELATQAADENGRISYSEIEKRCSTAEVDPCSMAHDLQSEEYEIDYGGEAAQA